jgi:undecaprenyl-diphosphatase
VQHEQRHDRPTRGPLSTGRTAATRVGLVLVLAGSTIAALARPAEAAAFAQTTGSAVENMLTWWKAAILGIVEGFTEYLPISSTGHLLVASRLLDLPDEKGSAGLEAVNTYAIAIQFGAILAVLGLFRRRFVEMAQGLAGRNPEGRHLLVILVIAFLPAAVLGAAFDNKIEDALFGPWPVVVAWIAGGILILVLERTGRIPDRGSAPATGGNRFTAITHRQALIIGLAQCVALWPGTSRSLATILGALLVGIAMPVAVEFSFLLGFATLSAATAFKLVKDGGTLVDQFGILNPVIGAVFAFAAAVVGIRWLITYLERHDLSIFAWYRFVVAGITIVLIATSVI